MTASPRLALYWTPDADHPLWQAGCDWLACDPESASALGPARAHTAEPRRYGFHATLKAPMVLRAGASPQDMIDAAARLAASFASFDMPALVVTTLRGFIALRPATTLAPAHPLRQLADACVRELDVLRRPLTPQERDRRLRSMDFDAQERDNLESFGYAFVFDRWQFHMTLSDSFAQSETAARDRMLADASQHFAPALRAPLSCNALSVFLEPSPGSPFQLVQRLPLGPCVAPGTARHHMADGHQRGP